MNTPTRIPLGFCYDRLGNRRRVVLHIDGREHRIHFGSLTDLGVLLGQIPTLHWQEAATILARVKGCMQDDERADSAFAAWPEADAQLERPGTERITTGDGARPVRFSLFVAVPLAAFLYVVRMAVMAWRGE